MVSHEISRKHWFDSNPRRKTPLVVQSVVRLKNIRRENRESTDVKQLMMSKRHTLLKRPNGEIGKHSRLKTCRFGLKVRVLLGVQDYLQGRNAAL